MDNLESQRGLREAWVGLKYYVRGLVALGVLYVAGACAPVEARVAPIPTIDPDRVAAACLLLAQSDLVSDNPACAIEVLDDCRRYLSSQKPDTQVSESDLNWILGDPHQTSEYKCDGPTQWAGAWEIMETTRSDINDIILGK